MRTGACASKLETLAMVNKDSHDLFLRIWGPCLLWSGQPDNGKIQGLRLSNFHGDILKWLCGS